MGSEEEFFSDLSLATYLEAIFPDEPLMPTSDQIEAECARHGGRTSGLAVNKVAAIKIKGKERVEEYVRSQHRSGCRPNTTRNSLQGLEAFIIYLQGTGKRDLEEIHRRDIEGFVEHEQDRGLKLSTVKTRLAIVEAFLRFMAQKRVMGEEVFPWKRKIKVP